MDGKRKKPTNKERERQKKKKKEKEERKGKRRNWLKGQGERNLHAREPTLHILKGRGKGGEGWRKETKRLS
jgi:hypothetical protein